MIESMRVNSTACERSFLKTVKLNVRRTSKVRRTFWLRLLHLHNRFAVWGFAMTVTSFRLDRTAEWAI